MKIAPLATGACALALLVSSPTRASIPGNLEERSNDGLLHVCRDVEPGRPKYLVCDEQDFTQFGNPYTGSECPAIGLQPACVIDTIPNVRLTGKLALIADDQPLDGDGNFNGDPSATLILDLTFDWKTITFIESFQRTKIGNWNEFDEFFLVDPTQDIAYTNAAVDALQFTNGNLVELGLKIRDKAQVFFPGADLSDAVPVLVSIVRNGSKEPLDQTGSGLASAAYFNVVVRFARVRP